MNVSWFSFFPFFRLGREIQTSEDKGHLQILYFYAALRYQIAARFCTIAEFSPVSGNTYHHAIEFYLKGALIEKLDEERRRNFSHDVRKLWRVYKKEFADPSLNKFDRTIAGLHKFERIRYPEQISTNGMTSEVGFVRNTAVFPSSTRYELVVDELDELVKVIFETIVLDSLSESQRSHGFDGQFW